MNARLLGFILVSLVAATGILLWGTSFPLGVPGEWTWSRLPGSAETLIGSGMALIAGMLYVGFVLYGRQQIERHGGVGRFAYVAALVGASLAWLWVLQDSVPPPADLGKTPYVLFYPRSSGYFWQARYEVTDTAEFLAGYEELMAEGDFLHIGTHPPGLTLGYRGLLTICHASPKFCELVLATRPDSVRRTTATIANLSAQSGRQITAVDQAALWLAGLMTLFAAALTAVGIYLLVARFWPRRTAWSLAGLWPLVPAIAVFFPKSDTLYPFIAVTAAALWFAACDRRSILLAMLSGAALWFGMMLSLAFATIAVLMAITTIGEWWSECDVGDMAIATGAATTRSRVLLLLAGAIGFLLPTFCLAAISELNLINVWRRNLANHALFYDHNPRTWGRWLWVNPLEMSLAVGWPVVAMACLSIWQLVRERQFLSKRSAATVGFLVVWSLLWLSGKNMGEAARLWILLMPWVLLASAPAMNGWRMEGPAPEEARRSSSRGGIVPVAMILVAQLIVCILTVQRIDGFHFTEFLAPAAVSSPE